MLTNSESMENLYGNDCYNDDRPSSTGFKISDERNRNSKIMLNNGIGSGETAYPVDRQDSLMLCQQLQEQDGFDFMDQNMDLTPYIRGLDSNSMEDLEPNIIDKQRMLECDIQMQQQQQQQAYASNPQYADLRTVAEAVKLEARGLDGNNSDPMVAVPETSGFVKKRRPIKLEIASSMPKTTKRGRITAEVFPTKPVKVEDSEEVEISFTPTIKPRKYSLKPEAEKKNPLYRLKREKNNDAVRRSRTKAKQQQKMKDEQIKQLQNQVTEFNNSIQRLENTIHEIERQKQALIVENLQLKNELQQVKRRCHCSTRTVDT